MLRRLPMILSAPTALLILGTLGLSGCAHVKPDQLQAELSDLRAELRDEREEGDRRLAGEGGLAQDRVRAVSYGEAGPRPIAPGDHGPGNEGWENRRVALVLGHGGA